MFDFQPGSEEERQYAEAMVGNHVWCQAGVMCDRNSAAVVKIDGRYRPVCVKHADKEKNHEP